MVENLPLGSGYRRSIVKKKGETWLQASPFRLGANRRPHFVEESDDPWMC